MVEVVHTIDDCRASREALEGTVAFVPTMGALHDGHRALMERGVDRADHLVVSIFVNPTQFEPGADYESYPRQLGDDRRICDELGASLVFAPDPDEMYAEDHSTTVRVADLTDVMCGPHRPGHFDGVTTVVTKLLNVVAPDLALFGRKDYQQLAILRRMVRDLNIPTQIVGVPTVREADGLAVSSRNRYLDDAERRRARTVPEALRRGWRAVNEEGVRDSDRLEAVTRSALEEAIDSDAIDYVECVDGEMLQPFEGEVRVSEDDSAILAVAAHVGDARLIDNVRLDEPLPDALERRRDE